jgi:hypothetical protein
VVCSEDLEPFSDSLLVIVAFDTVESREGGGGTSGKAVEEGDCSRDEGTETTTGDETAEVPPGLRPITLGRELLRFREPEERLSVLSVPASFAPPTDALIRLYRPLRPPCTSSMPFGSPEEAGAGGAVRSSKVVRESECDAVRCSWCSVSCSDSREPLAMAAVFVAGAIQAGARPWAWWRAWWRASGGAQWQAASGFMRGARAGWVKRICRYRHRRGEGLSEGAAVVCWPCSWIRAAGWN